MKRPGQRTRHASKPQEGTTETATSPGLATLSIGGLLLLAPVVYPMPIDPAKVCMIGGITLLLTGAYLLSKEGSS